MPDGHLVFAEEHNCKALSRAVTGGRLRRVARGMSCSAPATPRCWPDAPRAGRLLGIETFILWGGDPRFAAREFSVSRPRRDAWAHRWRYADLDVVHDGYRPSRDPG